MWNHREELTGKIRARASRWPCGQLVLQVECARYDLFQADGVFTEQCTNTVWRDAETSDLNDLGYLSAESGSRNDLQVSIAAQTEFFKIHKEENIE